ncbi:unnamed protein product [Cyclocybe aegerita]|uniref:Uncharacterized protein n=1 Tax=Cyclocybe aegerita TaxID=1973307 RepID=A0A8S0WSU1_CYCAE|nr:unnamed protein product [Cyclocybe aegerita]
MPARAAESPSFGLALHSPQTLTTVPLTAVTVPHCSATMTMTVTRPVVSSPLADSTQGNIPAVKRVVAKRNPSFAPSRALRPFPGIAHLGLHPTKANAPGGQRSVKLIEPPKNFKATFVLDLTQAEFSRQ